MSLKSRLPLFSHIDPQHVAKATDAALANSRRVLAETADMVWGRRRGILSAHPPLPIATAAEINTMQRVHTAYCRERGIKNREERDRVSERLLRVHDRGARDEEAMLAELAASEELPVHLS